MFHLTMASGQIEIQLGSANSINLYHRRPNYTLSHAGYVTPNDFGLSVICITRSYNYEGYCLLLFSTYSIQCHNWLQHCVTSRKFAGSIPDYVIGIFH
jgi:hypothetical protein